MAEYTIELDAVHETMIREITDDNVDPEDFLNQSVEQFIYNLYQQKE